MALTRDYKESIRERMAELGRLTAKSPKSLMRMFGPAGNPQAGDLFGVIRVLQEREGIRLAVRAEAAVAA